MQYFKIIILCLLLQSALRILFKVPSPDAFATVLRVTQDYQTIQSAIDDAETGDTVLIGPGTYQEELLISRIGITLAGEFLLTGDPSDVETTEISGGNQFRPLTIQSTVDSAVYIIGLSFVNGHAEWENDGPGGGIYVDGIELHLLHNIIRDNWADYSGGASLNRCNAEIKYNSFINNQSTHSTGGIYVNDGYYEVAGNNFINNRASAVGGGMVGDNSSGFIYANLFYNNSSYLSGGGLSIINGGNWDVQRNIFRENNASDG